MTFATREHLQAFNRITTEIILLAPQLEALGIGSAALVQHNAAAGNLDGAAVAGTAALDHLAGEYQRLMEGFQVAVADLMGEHPDPMENPVDFFGRIYRMGADGWMELARKNGVELHF